jgi:DNA-binding response OmpR family regulator
MADILIVEDDPNISGLYAYILKRRGFLVHQARDVPEGLQLLARTRPGLIILDLLMPGENGIDFLKQAHLQKDYPGTQVLVVSNVDSVEFTKELAPYPVEAYVTKAEYTPHRLADMIEKMVGGRESGRIGLLGRLLRRRGR